MEEVSEWFMTLKKMCSLLVTYVKTKIKLFSQTLMTRNTRLHLMKNDVEVRKD